MLEKGTAGVVDNARGWAGQKIKTARGIGFENKVAAKPILYEGNRDKPLSEAKAIFDQGFWIPGKGILTPTPVNHVALWFEMKGAQGNTSAVDQSDKYLVDLDMSKDEAEEVTYSEDVGWPLKKVEPKTEEAKN